MRSSSVLLSISRKKRLCTPFLFCIISLCLVDVAHARTSSSANIGTIPEEVRSSYFRVSINGHPSEVLHAATGYYLLNFNISGPVTVSVTAANPHYWDAGVEIQPMRLGIRPVRHGATITFPLAGPEKLSISRPGDHFADAEMLFLFANPPEFSHIDAQTPNVRYYSPGAHHENIDAHSGDTIYLAAGAVVFGSLNVWQVHDVHVLGTGTILYDGPQDPHSDEGWMHKPNWHCIVMDNAQNIEIDGITCITRSRSWQIQMRDSHHIGFYNVKVIGGNPNDANQDGMDWLGGGETAVRNSFFRASDDVFALQGNWEGYGPALLRVPGHDVTNITIENTIVSTSISNTVRVNWPQKTFNSAHFYMNNVDVLHTGFGGCGVPFAFFELWADPDGQGTHQDYRFSDIRLEDWYSLFQIRQPLPSVRNVTFTDIWAMDGPAMVPSVAKGKVSDVDLQGVTLQGYKGAEPGVEDEAQRPTLHPAALNARFTYTGGLLYPHQRISFTADTGEQEGRHFEWLFGDGSRKQGRAVEHAFPDAEGTLLDRSGRFRVLLHITDDRGGQAWSSESVVLVRPSHGHETVTEGSGSPLDDEIIDRLVRIPVDGGYTFTMLTSLEATLAIDEMAPVHTPMRRAQVCGSKGDAVQPVRISTALTAGDHRLRIIRKRGLENAGTLPGSSEGKPAIVWEGPGMERQPIPNDIESGPTQ